MKNSLVAFLFLFLNYHFTFAQQGSLPLDDKQNAVYSDRASVEHTRDTLFQNAQKWVVRTFGNYENAVDKEDRASGRLILKTYAPVRSAAYEYLRFTMTIVCQDNQYQVVVNELEGIARSQSITKLGKRQNDAVLEKAVVIKTESNKRKRIQAENELAEIKSDNDNISQAIYGLLASLKQEMTVKSDD